MKLNSVVVKLFLGMATIVMILSLGSSMYVNDRVQTNIEHHIDEEVELIAESIKYALNPLINVDQTKVIGEILGKFENYDLVETIYLYDPKGQVVYASNKEAIGTRENINHIIQAYVNDTSGKDILRDNHTVQIYLDRALVVIGLNPNYGSFVGKVLHRDIWMSFLGIYLVLIIMVYMYIQRVIGRPMLGLMKAANEISNHNYSYRVNMDSGSEFDELANAFNSMANNIEENTVELELAVERAEQASNARLEFLAKMSHEIRTPLNAIIGFSDVLAEEITDKEHKESIDIIVNSGKHLLDLINEVLDIAKIENNQVTIESQPFSLRSLIYDVCRMFYLPAEEKGLDLSYEISVDVPLMLVGDSYRIRQIMMNLLSNAIKFTDSGSIEVLVDIEDGKTTIRVIDTGMGISSENQDSIFNAYTQSNSTIEREYGGTGLGLSISKRIAQMMGGDIGLRSTPKRGSEFIVTLELGTIHLPEKSGHLITERWLHADSTITDIVVEAIETLPQRLSDIEAASQADDREALKFHVHSLKGVSGNFSMMEIYELTRAFDAYLQSDEIRRDEIFTYVSKLKDIIRLIPNDIIGGEPEKTTSSVKENYKVLLAEDIKENQMLIQKILKNMPVKLDIANNGVEAIEKLEKDNYDCVLLDIQMPVLSGEDVLNHIRKSEAIDNVYIVALTANAFVEDMEKYLSMGAHWFLSKPVNKNALRKKIEELIQLKIEKNIN